jgi:hypothetical protein
MTIESSQTGEQSVKTAPAKKPRLPFRSMRSNTSEGTTRRLGLARPVVRRSALFGTLAYAASRLPGGKHTLMEYAHLCEDEPIKALVCHWDSLSGYDQRRTSLENLCEVCGVEPHELVGAVAAAAFRWNADISTLIAAVAHPKVMEACVDRAVQANGFRDREMFFKASGLLPTPAASSIRIFNTAATGTTTTGADSGLPSFEEHVLTFSEIIRNAVEEPSPPKANPPSDRDLADS